MYFGSRYLPGARDLIELMQRFDIEAEAAYIRKRRPQPRWEGTEAAVERILKLLGRPWDCFVFSTIPITHLPVEAQYQVVKADTDGAVFTLDSASENPGSYRFARRYQAGQYHIDAITRSKDGVEAWATVPIEITASRKIEAIELDKDWEKSARRSAGGSNLPVIP